ncbi:unnamed protein product [Heterobilharzia americana]|nr:unnamed protein product [Heterobilharzia americana]
MYHNLNESSQYPGTVAGTFFLVSSVPLIICSGCLTSALLIIQESIQDERDYRCRDPEFYKDIPYPRQPFKPVQSSSLSPMSYPSAPPVPIFETDQSKFSSPLINMEVFIHLVIILQSLQLTKSRYLTKRLSNIHLIFSSPKRFISVPYLFTRSKQYHKMRTKQNQDILICALTYKITHLFYGKNKMTLIILFLILPYLFSLVLVVLLD